LVEPRFDDRIRCRHSASQIQIWRIVMFCLPGCLRTFVFVLLLVLLTLSEASAHCFVGARFFPATLATDDPSVADEMSLPTVAWSGPGNIPPATQWAISGDLAKRITEDFGISI